MGASSCRSCTGACLGLPDVEEQRVTDPFRKEFAPLARLGVVDEKAKIAAFHRNFRIVSKIGHGAYAQVFHATQTDEEGVVEDFAFKVQKWNKSGSPNKASVEAPGEVVMRELAQTARLKESQKARDRIQREVEVMRTLSSTSSAGSESCVRLVDHFFDETFAYILMEFCETNLFGSLKAPGGTTNIFLQKVFSDVLASLKFLCEQGVVHRDVKPDNFVCRPADSQRRSARDRPRAPERVDKKSFLPLVKLCDFGLAKMLPSEGAPVLRGTCGTTPFMSPEMLHERDYDTGTDVWSAGVMMYSLTYGRFPYMAQNASGIKHAIIRGHPAPPFKLKAGLYEKAMEPEWTLSASKSLIESLLTREPSERPTAAEASKNAFFCQQVPVEETLLQSLRLARKVGVFDKRGNREMVQEIAELLKKDQRRHRLEDLDGSAGESLSSAGPCQPKEVGEGAEPEMTQDRVIRGMILRRIAQRKQESISERSGPSSDRSGSKRRDTSGYLVSSTMSESTGTRHISDASIVFDESEDNCSSIA